jgi:hypothetical protein
VGARHRAGAALPRREDRARRTLPPLILCHPEQRRGAAANLRPVAVPRRCSG